MANWAKLQEQLTGLPVVKRARNSIHFDKGNGQVVANFSGKPCHYQDTDGLWKPIDTKLLLLPDGFYGSPHSDVKIHKDGRVKAGGYQQKSALVAAKEGVVDGDKIVREFKFGTQYLYMKEDGFRQETVITRPPTTAEAKYLIASESGELPSKYKRSDITAVDADGAVHEFVNLGQFKKWLDAAAYPVTIDPDFVAQPDGTAGMDTHLIATAADTNYGTSGEFNIQYTGSQHARGLIKFDLSTLAGTTIVSATQYYTAYANVASTATTYMHRILSGNSGWTETGATWNTKDGINAWAGSAGCNTSGTDFSATAIGTNSSQYTANTEYSMDLDVTEFTAMVAANYGCVVFVTASWTQKKWHSSDALTPSHRPRLVVTYTAGSTGVPKHFLHYARLRSN